MIALMGSEAPGAVGVGAASRRFRSSAQAHRFWRCFLDACFCGGQLQPAARLATEISEMKSKARLRPKVVRTVISVMQQHDLDEDAAYKLIRDEAMKRRQSVEALCESGFFDPGNGHHSPPKPNKRNTGSR